MNSDSKLIFEAYNQVNEHRMTRTPGFINISDKIIHTPDNEWVIWNRNINSPYAFGKDNILHIGGKVEWYYPSMGEHFYGILSDKLVKNAIGALNMAVVIPMNLEDINKIKDLKDLPNIADLSKI